MIESLIISLILTLLIELTISYILGIRKNEDIQVVIWANILTNPIVVFTANCISLINNNVIYNIVVMILEISAVITEAIIFKKFLDFKEKSPLLISIINNTKVKDFYGMKTVLGNMCL